MAARPVIVEQSVGQDQLCDLLNLIIFAHVCRIHSGAGQLFGVYIQTSLPTKGSVSVNQQHVCEFMPNFCPLATVQTYGKNSYPCHSRALPLNTLSLILQQDLCAHLTTDFFQFLKFGPANMAVMLLHLLALTRTFHSHWISAMHQPSTTSTAS